MSHRDGFRAVLPGSPPPLSILVGPGKEMGEGSVSLLVRCYQGAHFKEGWKICLPLEAKPHLQHFLQHSAIRKKSTGSQGREAIAETSPIAGGLRGTGNSRASVDLSGESEPLHPAQEWNEKKSELNSEFKLQPGPDMG